MPLEKQESEWRARVRQPAEFEWLKQIWPSKNGNPNYPYNSKGIRSIGGALKSNPDKIADQSIRFSRKTKFKWTEAKIKKWITKNGHTLKSLDKIHPRHFDHYSKEVATLFRIITPDFKIKAYTPGKPLIVEGVINSDSVDTYNEIVDPKAVMASKDWYMEFPTVRWMHEHNPIGRTLDIWRENNLVYARVEIDANETKIIEKIITGTIKAFSIGFMVLGREEYCPNNATCIWRITKILLVEISPVDSPANRDARFVNVGWKTLRSLTDRYEVNGMICENGICRLKDGAKLSDLEYRTTLLTDDQEAIEPPNNMSTNINLQDYGNVTKCKECEEKSKSLNNQIKKKGESMDETGKEKIEELEPVDDEEETEVDPTVETEPTTQETDPVEETPTEESASEKVLKAVEGLTAKLGEVEKELERQKMTEEERKEAEAIDAKAKEITEGVVKANTDLEKQVNELKHKLEVKEAVEKAVSKLPVNQRASISADLNAEQEEDPEDEFAGMGFDEKTKADYREMCAILKRHL